MQYAEYDDEMIDDVPVSAGLKVLRQGQIDEEDDEAVSWSEVQRLLHERDWGAILKLPATKDDFFSGCGFDGAFDTHDFWRRHGGDLRRYDAALDWARREEECVMITLSMVLDRLPLVASNRVFNYLQRGVIDKSMVHDDIRAVLRLSKRQDRINKRIEQIAWARKRRWWRGDRDD